MYCEKCGNQMKDTDVFCQVCGHKAKKDTPDNTLTQEAFNPVPENEQNYNVNNLDKKENKLSKSSLAIIISLGATILILLIAILIFIFKSNHPSTQPIENPSSPALQDEKIQEKEVNEIDDDVITNVINENTLYTQYGVYVKNLTNGYEYSYKGNNVFLSSAMGQVVILDTLSYACEEKGIDIDDETLYFSYMPNGKEAPNSKNENGEYISLKKCIEDVAVYGDNNKSNHIIDYIAYLYGEPNGFGVINNALSKRGYPNTQLNRKTYIDSKYIDHSASPNVTTAYEINDMFYNLIFNSSFGSEVYMKNIFKSISNNGEAIGLKKFVPSYFDICNVNALNSQCTNNVAYISDGKTEIIVTILAQTQEDKTNTEDNDSREAAVEKIINHILDTQFDY